MSLPHGFADAPPMPHAAAPLHLVDRDELRRLARRASRPRWCSWLDAQRLRRQRRARRCCVPGARRRHRRRGARRRRSARSASLSRTRRSRCRRGDWQLAGDARRPARCARCSWAGAWAATASTATSSRRARRRGWRSSGDATPRRSTLLAACVRVRDLVNTPTEHMGPEQLETVARELAQALRRADRSDRRRRPAAARTSPRSTPSAAPRTARRG